ncbi:MAG: hypothetical protein BGO31_00745 [Bacteroidetes bacterium 43-16]|nr:MAG: hypothetical protein BGO31_00745 [Bacteroidetes bacterium 43-16]
MSHNIRIIAQDQGETLNIAGGTYRIIVPGAATNGAYAIIEMSVPPGAGPVPHEHPGFEEIFFVLEGELYFTSANGTFPARKGDTVAIPKGGGVHNFKNRSEETAKLLCTVVPAGLDNFFSEAAAYLDTKPGNEVDIKEKLRLLSEKYGQQLYPPDYWER